MHVVIAAMEDLWSRGEAIKRSLRHVSAQDSGPAWDTKSPNGSFVIAAHDGDPPDRYDLLFVTVPELELGEAFQVFLPPRWEPQKGVGEDKFLVKPLYTRPNIFSFSSR